MAAQQQPADEDKYQQQTEELKTFLLNFKEVDLDGQEQDKYMNVLQQVANRRAEQVTVELEDISQNVGEEMADAISKNASRYRRLLADAIDAVMPEPTEGLASADIADVLSKQRRERSDANTDSASTDPQQQIPPELLRRYEVRILPRHKEKAVALREVRASSVGSLLTVKGIVTRVTEVKPRMKVATYTCQQGGFEAYQTVTGREFMPLFQCPSAGCCNGGRLHLQTRGCKFGKFQEVKIQEEADQVPTGHVPRTMTVHLSGELTRICSAGDTIVVSGVFMPVPHVGYRALKAGLVVDTYLEAMAVEKQKKSYLDFTPTFETQQRLEELLEEGDMYTKMAASIAPEIFGHEDVKKALLLLMVGGATRKMADGMKIRGDINICLMGDPGVAKSQLLRHISKIAPRAVYTTGKGSSGVGLTAAVIRDIVTGDLVLEGGALVLADMGICCIDEFDKMEDGDRTAIHEVMEQQTVSIAKAGITTTLNARTSVLAAANPMYSRYNPSKTPEENINLPAALLSRFDLLWLILDKPLYDSDLQLAQHVTYVHRYSTHPPLTFEPLDPQLMRAYISTVRQLEPSVPPDVAQYVVDEYVQMRKEADAQGPTFGFTSARTLLAILRLAQALARLRNSKEVDRNDIVEARRLMTLSRSSVIDAGMDDEKKGVHSDPISQVYHVIREHAISSGQSAVNVSDVLPKVISRGRTQEDLDNCMQQYEELSIWQLVAKRTIIRFVDDPNEEM